MGLSLQNKLHIPEVDLYRWPWAKETSSKIYATSVSWPKISIVTPSFNQGKFIEETIRSVLLQNYPNLEYIIIDGGSTDETISIIKKYEHSIAYWVSEPDKGQSHAINKGLEKCTGDIFNWLNSDDWYMPDTFFEVASKFMADAGLKFVSGFENHIGLDGSISLYNGTYLCTTIEETIESCEVAQPSTFFKLNLIRQIGTISEDLHYIMDGEMWVRLLLLNGQDHFFKINKPLVNFRSHEDSKTVKDIFKNDFLSERSSIITDLQQAVGVPGNIIRYFNEQIYSAPKVIPLNRNWQFNDHIVSPKKLKIYFIKKFVTKQFIQGNRQEAIWGIKQLLINGAFDLYFLKSLLKLVLKRNYK